MAADDTQPATSLDLPAVLYALDVLDSLPVPNGVQMLATWEQARLLGMTREQWEAGEFVSPTIRLFGGGDEKGGSA
jgi:hypothetical protein